MGFLTASKGWAAFFDRGAMPNKNLQGGPPATTKIFAKKWCDSPHGSHWTHAPWDPSQWTAPARRVCVCSLSYCSLKPSPLPSSLSRMAAAMEQGVGGPCGEAHGLPHGPTGSLLYSCPSEGCRHEYSCKASAT